MSKILVANGVNLDLCGTRNTDIYGSFTLQDLEDYLTSHAQKIAPLINDSCELCFFQTNDEAAYLQEISKNWRGALLNPGAWTHTSIALSDRLEALDLPYVEVHISNLSRRENFRRRSYISKHALASISGAGMKSYLAALVILLGV